jgi:RimJ/RimL family protein N-acetyltransferase
MGLLPIRTERLLLRMMRVDDAPALAAYRTLDDIARYQDWDLPYTVEMGGAALAAQDHLDDVTVGEWVQVAIEHDGVVVGDLAVVLVNGGHVAQIGYTLATAHQGKGYASEAAGALVDALFATGDVHRVVATLDPANHASMRVVEGLGFTWEGTARNAELIRGEWMDDMRFALLREEREAWLAPKSAITDVRLIEITSHNRDDVLALTTHRFQRRFVATMPDSFADALVPDLDDSGAPLVPWMRAIETTNADGSTELVGFMMRSEVTSTEPYPFLWRFLIDRRHQRRGIGARAMALLIDDCRAAGHEFLYTSWVDEPGGPRPFYEGLGFVATGEFEEDEVVARLTLR